MKEKNKQFLILQAIAIILVVIGHKSSIGFSILNDYLPIYSYHMALFFFISGYFFKIENINKPLKYIWKKIKHLVIPFYIYNTIYGLVNTILLKKGIVSFGSEISFKTLIINGWTVGDQFVFNLATWFVLALFIVQICYLIIRILIEKFQYKNELTIFIALLFIGIVSLKIEDNTPITVYQWPIFRTLFFLPFFQFGYLYKLNSTFIDNIKTIHYFTFLLTLILYLKLSGLDLSYIVSYLDFKGNSVTPYISSFIGILFFLRVSKLLEKSLSKNKLICYIGENSWDIMIHHLFVFFLINYIFYRYNFQGFDVNTFKKDIFYNYFINGNINYIYLYYTLAIFIPLGGRWILNWLQDYSNRLFSNGKTK